MVHREAPPYPLPPPSAPVGQSPGDSSPWALGLGAEAALACPWCTLTEALLAEELKGWVGARLLLLGGHRVPRKGRGRHVGSAGVPQVRLAAHGSASRG